jgi:hypothetical protein
MLQPDRQRLRTPMTRLRLTTTGRTVLASVLLASAAAHADTIGGGQINASTALGQYLSFSIDQMTDGITADSPPL